MGFFTKKALPEGSAFTKIADGHIKIKEARGRVAAVEATNKFMHQVADELENDASRVHAETDAVHTRCDSILRRL